MSKRSSGRAREGAVPGPDREAIADALRVLADALTAKSEDRMLSYPEVAKRFGRGRDWVANQLVGKGLVPVVTVGGSRFIRESDLDQAIRMSTERPGAGMRKVLRLREEAAS